ncbi:MAG: GNAT family N-acetyltransferase [Bdellovibrionota bacterium]
MFSDGISFRNADINDVNFLFTFLNAAYRGDTARQGWTFESDLVGGLRITPEEIADSIEKAKESFLLAVSGNKIVGCVQLVDEGDELYFGMIAVDPKMQNQKIGAKILEEIDRIARSQKKVRVRLVVIHTRAELIAYYERRGFHSTGMSEAFPSEYPAKIPGLLLMEMKKTL